MDKFNNSNSTLALQKFYNQNNNVRLFELQQRLKTEQIVCQIEMKKLINEDSKFTKTIIDLIGHHFITDQLVGIIVGNATAKVVAGGSGVLCGSKLAITLKILTIIILFL